MFPILIYKDPKTGTILVSSGLGQDDLNELNVRFATFYLPLKPAVHY